MISDVLDSDNIESRKTITFMEVRFKSEEKNGKQINVQDNFK